MCIQTAETRNVVSEEDSKNLLGNFFTLLNVCVAATQQSVRLFLIVGPSDGTLRKPLHTHGNHANSTEKCLRLYMNPLAEHCAAVCGHGGSYGHEVVHTRTPLFNVFHPGTF